MEKRRILVIDETIREGMQYRAVMFSHAQRLKILEFQEKLGVDICQAAYPPAHESEIKAAEALILHAQKNRFQIRIAVMGRLHNNDAEILLDTGAFDLHFHININPEAPDPLPGNLPVLLDHIKSRNPDCCISLAMLDMGRFEDCILEKYIQMLPLEKIDILSMPDTSGMMAPVHVFEKIHNLVLKNTDITISVHCHNDMGMASANTVTGIYAGAKIIEVSALGIGERNGIADLYTTVKTLKNMGFETGVNTDDMDTFRQYYRFIDSIVHEQTGNHLLTQDTPVFGSSVNTHVAGTHAQSSFGLTTRPRYDLNVLCGKHLVKKYLKAHNFECPPESIDGLTKTIKGLSAAMNRRITLQDIKKILAAN